jgi:threonine/homoserine/homoserine lactone efflux protein
MAAGVVIAMQVGAVSLLLVETAVVRGTRIGVAAGMGVATVDLLFAAAAAAAGATAGAMLAEHELEIRLVAAATLAAIAVHGLVALRSAPSDAAEDPAAAGGPRAHYVRFFAITFVNPLTIASFAAVATSLPLGAPSAAAAFAAGVGVASAGWHLLLTVAAGHAGRWITPRIRMGLSVGGRVAVLLLAAHLALAG